MTNWPYVFFRIFPPRHFFKDFFSATDDVIHTSLLVVLPVTSSLIILTRARTQSVFPRRSYQNLAFHRCVGNPRCPFPFVCTVPL